MTEMILCTVEPFTSPVWGSNFVVFSGQDGNAVGEKESRAYISRCCKYAKHHGAYLVPERFMLMGYQCMCLISPEGKVMGAQKCLYWNTDSRAVKRSTTLEVISTEFGGVLLCVDVDIYRPEVVRIAAGMGAQIVICSQQVSMADYNSSTVVNGVWNSAQTGSIYVVGVCNAFHCVCAPRSMTTHDDGFLVPPNLKIPMNARLSAEALTALPPRFRLNRKFYAVHRRELVERS